MIKKTPTFPPYLVSLVALFGCANGCFAHEGGHRHTESPTPSRTWTWSESGAHVHGSFLTAEEGKVTIQRDGGPTLSVTLDQLVESDRQWVEQRVTEIERLNASAPISLLAQIPQRKPADPRQGRKQQEGPPPNQAPAIHQHFSPFRDTLALRWDNRHYYVESNGLPNHPMMIGITAWQQQVPLPQSYRGDNAWRIPLHPVPAKTPMSAKTNFFRGAIALAVNGIPIFNPIKNDGKTDTFLAGELDRWGGHCGRADDYHYHLPPVHLQQTVGAGNPIAYALDGYPIYGYQDEQADDFAPLDWLNGHRDADGNYHYHATKSYPYLNGGFYGEVVQRDGQVDPQPRARGPRPALTPLRGARITGFRRSDDGKQFNVDYELRGENRAVRYVIDDQDRVTFHFDEGSDGTRQATYPLGQPTERRSGAGQPQGRREQPPGGGPGRPPGRQPRNMDRRSGASEPKPDTNRVAPADRQRVSDTEPRRPWIEVHAAEMDTDEDGLLTQQEIEQEGRLAFAAYDSNQDGLVSLTELSAGRPVRSAMGGFLREHSKELDRNDDGTLSQEEILQNAGRMFAKADTDGDGRIVVTIPSPPPSSSRSIRSATPNLPQPEPVKAGSRGGSEDQPPNVVFILIDDMGWNDVGFAGNRFVETTHIDRLASEGIQFTQAYASAPNCAPTRACLMSGQYTPRHGVYTVIDPRHDPGQPNHRIVASPSEASLRGDVITIAELLKHRGYATACFGMWNLGRGRHGPTTATGQGFDLYQKPQDLGFEQNAYFDAAGRYLTDVLFDEGLRFIDQHQHEPFFLYLPTHAVHAPFDPKPELVDKYREKAKRLRLESVDPVYAAMIEAVDHNVGRLLAHLDQLRLSEQTLVIFTSDNGGTSPYIGPLNGSKGALYEGGIRVPCAVWWAGIRHPGRTSDEPIVSMDFYPTLAELCGADLPVNQPTDGISLLPILQQTGNLNRDAIYWHFPCYIGRGEPCSAIRYGDWKLIEKFENQSLELYNLQDDPGETRNLADSMPDQTQTLHRYLTTWQAATGAPRDFSDNPAFDPTSSARKNRRR